MAGYSYLSRVQDPAAQAALKSAFDQIAKLTADLAALRAQTLTVPTLSEQGINLNGVRLTNLGTPTADSDALTVGFARQLIRAEVETFGI